MRLSNSSKSRSSRTRKSKYYNKDASHIMTKISSSFFKMGTAITSTTSACYNHKKSSNLVIHSSKKISLSLFSHFSFSLLMMVVIALIQLFSYSLPLVECIERPNINKYFPYGIHNQQDVTQRNSRLFPTFGVHRAASLRDSIPSSTYSKSIRRASQARQIQPLSCVSKRTKEEGVCMFAWTCVEQGGEHLGTCIDRFYFGSCCKLKEDNTIPDSPGSTKPSISVKPSSISTILSSISSNSPITTTTTIKPTTTTTTTTPTTTTSTTSTSTTRSTTLTTTATTTTTTKTTTTTTTTIATTLTSTTSTTTPKTTTTSKTSTSTTPTSTAPTTTTVTTTKTTTRATTAKPLSVVTETEAVETTPKEVVNKIETDTFNTTSNEIPSTVPADIDNKNSVTTTPSSTTIASTSTSTTTTTTTSPPTTTKATTTTTFATTITSAAQNSTSGPKVSYKEICGTRPWFKDPSKPSTYKHGVRNGLSEAKIGISPKRTPYDGGLKVRGDSLRRWGRHISFSDSWNNRQGRIVNGMTADYGEWPWQVSLRQWRTATFLHKCGCALLNENWAITAAHCVENVSPDDLLLRMGEYDLNSDEEPHKHIDRKVQIVASHPKFDPKTFEYDLALLRFYDKVDFQPNIIPICVPEEDRSIVGETAWVTGWGRLYEDGPLPSVMQEVDLPIINNTMCEKMYRDAGYVEHIPNIFICAGYAAGGKDSCEGDSGGPMVVQAEDGRFMLSGVISWGIGCAEKNQPGVYTRISQFSSWINQILQF